jgi:hypothetical protein
VNETIKRLAREFKKASQEAYDQDCDLDNYIALQETGDALVEAVLKAKDAQDELFDFVLELEQHDAEELSYFERRSLELALALKGALK